MAYSSVTEWINALLIFFPARDGIRGYYASRELESAGAAISRTSRPLESVIYHEQQIRDEQERQAQELARRWHEEQEPEARIWRGPSMGM